VAGLLKSFLRELPQNILTLKLHPEFLQVIGERGFFQHWNIEIEIGPDLHHRNDKVNELGRLISQLPLANYTTLRFLTAHLIHIVQNEKANKMSLRNIGIVFSPTLAMPAPLFSLLVSEFHFVFGKYFVIHPARRD
jgi:RalA-binding protein 1